MCGKSSGYAFSLSHELMNCPAVHTPTANVPKEKIPNENTPTEKRPTEKSPAEKTPTEKRPAESTPVLHNPPDSQPDAAVPVGMAFGKGERTKPITSNTISTP